MVSTEFSLLTHALSNFKFIPARSTLAFSAYVYDDEDLDTVQLQDEEWKMSKITARAYDSLYVRHWDQYIGPKHSSLFTVQLNKESGAWTLSGKIHALLNGTRHVSCSSVQRST